MTAAGNAADYRGSGRREFEEIEGEIEAAMIFAAATADFQMRPGSTALARTCLSDATTGYARALGAFLKADLTDAQRNELKPSLMLLEQVLKSLRKPLAALGRNS
jgi:hypothetical protein